MKQDVLSVTAETNVHMLNLVSFSNLNGFISQGIVNETKLFNFQSQLNIEIVNFCLELATFFTIKNDLCECDLVPQLNIR